MEIKIDTNNISAQDRAILSFILEQNREKKASLTTARVKFPKIHGKTRETIIEILKHLETATFEEIKAETDIPDGTIRSQLTGLKQEGIVSASMTAPKRYFLKTIGDKELASRLKEKVSYMG